LAVGSNSQEFDNTYPSSVWMISINIIDSESRVNVSVSRHAGPNVQKVRGFAVVRAVQNQLKLVVVGVPEKLSNHSFWKSKTKTKL